MNVQNPSAHHSISVAAERDLQFSVPSSMSPPWKTKLPVVGKYVLYLALVVAVTAIVAALGVLTAPVSAALLLVFLITYSFARPAALFGIEKLKNVTKVVMVGFTCVAILLCVSLITLFLVFRLVPVLEGKRISGMEVWKWLEIALVSCIFCIIWIGGSFLWTYVQYEYDYDQNLVYFVNASRWAVNCIFFFGGELLVIKVAPHAKHKVVIYGLPIWKWIAVIDLIICACHLIRVATQSVTYLVAYQQRISNKSSSSNKYMVYLAKGLRANVNVVLFMVLILLTWIFYVNDRLKLDGSSDSAKKFLWYAQRTFVALLIWSVLWATKHLFLLLWEAREIYERFTDRMLKGWMQWYFLILIAGPDEAQLENYINWEVGQSGRKDRGEKPEDEMEDAAKYGNKQAGEGQSKPEEAGEEKKKERKAKNAKGRIQQILNRAKKELITYDVLHRMSRQLLAAEESWSEDEKSPDSVLIKISKFRENWKTQYDDDSILEENDLQNNIEEVIKMDQGRNSLELEENYFKLLYEQLKDVDPSRKKVWFGDLDKWLIRAYKNCLILGRALAGNKEVVVYLNKIFTVGSCVTVFVIWLFLIELTSIEIFAAIASPIIAVAFVFGDTAKTLFQGMIFTFGVHPFDVGDICVISSTEQTLEVKRIGIWKTVFLKEGSKDQEVIYPNSALLSATIIKHKNVLDLSDYLEFSLTNASTEKDEEIMDLKPEIEKYLEDNDEKFEKDSFQMIVKEIGEKVKIRVTFKHVMSFQDMTYSECLKKKNQSTSDLLGQIRKLVNQYEKKVALPSERDVSDQRNHDGSTGVAGPPH